MKKTIFAIILVILLLSSFSVCVFADVSDGVYRDDNLQISFAIPENWSEAKELEVGRTSFALKKNGDGLGTYFEYSVFDMYDNASEEAKSKFSRSDVNNSTVTVEQFTQIVSKELENDETISNLVINPATVNGKSFFKINFNQNIDGSILQAVTYCHIYNGYITYYRYETFEDTLDEAEAESIVSTVEFENEKGSNKTQTDSQKTVKAIGRSAGKGLIKGIVIAAITGIGGVMAGIKAKKRAKKNPPPEINPDYNYIPTVAQPTSENRNNQEDNNPDD